MSTEDQVKIILEEFMSTVNSVAGVCFDAVRGFDLNSKEMTKFQQEFIRKSNSPEPKDVQLQHLDSAWFLYGEGNPNDPKSVIRHQTTQLDFKTRNSPGGRNHVFIGNMGLITIFQYWEHEYRARLANILGVQTDYIQSDVFGDMRLIRNSIIHHNGIAQPELVRCKVLRWFKPGDLVLIDQPKFNELLDILRIIEIKIPRQSPPTTT